MKTSELDPLFLVDQYPRSTPLVTLELTQGKLFGLAGLKRTGPIFVGFERDAVYMLLNLGIENVKGMRRKSPGASLNSYFLLSILCLHFEHSIARLVCTSDGASFMCNLI